MTSGSGHKPARAEPLLSVCRVPDAPSRTRAFPWRSPGRIEEGKACPCHRLASCLSPPPTGYGASGSRDGGWRPGDLTSSGLGGITVTNLQLARTKTRPGRLLASDRAAIPTAHCAAGRHTLYPLTAGQLDNIARGSCRNVQDPGAALHHIHVRAQPGLERLHNCMVATLTRGVCWVQDPAPGG